MSLIAAMVFTMSVSVYAPDAGGINGGGMMADGNEPHFGYAACGSNFPFGTIFEIISDIDMENHRLPQVVECRDRGGWIGRNNLDLVVRTGNVQRDLAIAYGFGRRRLQVRVWPSWSARHLYGQPLPSTTEMHRDVLGQHRVRRSIAEPLYWSISNAPRTRRSRG